jgi:hypothetical protein
MLEHAIALGGLFHVIDIHIGEHRTYVVNNAQRTFTLQDGLLLDGSVRDALVGPCVRDLFVIANRAELVLAAPAPADPQDAIGAPRVVARG